MKSDMLRSIDMLPAELERGFVRFGAARQAKMQANLTLMDTLAKRDNKNALGAFISLDKRTGLMTFETGGALARDPAVRTKLGMTARATGTPSNESRKLVSAFNAARGRGSAVEEYTTRESFIDVGDKLIARRSLRGIQTIPRLAALK